MKQNITVTIDKPILKEARKIAVNRGKSVSGLLADELRKLTSREAEYERAKAKALAHLKSPFHMGGRKLTTREELHDRKGLR